MKPILTLDCAEHSPYKQPKVVTRKVYPLEFTVENLRRFFMEASKFPTVFGEENSRDFGRFVNVFLQQNDSGELEGKGLAWVIDDFVGVYYLTDITHPYDAVVHYSFFDRRTHGRLELTREMLKYVFKKYGFRRLSAEVPLYANDTFRFIERVGFTKEGRKRKGIQYKNDWFDTNLYGILREEVI